MTVTFIVAGCRKKPIGSHAEERNINGKFMTTEQIVKWVNEINTDKKDKLTPKAEKIISDIEKGYNTWFDTKDFMFAAIRTNV